MVRVILRAEHIAVHLVGAHVVEHTQPRVVAPRSAVEALHNAAKGERRVVGDDHGRHRNLRLGGTRQNLLKRSGGIEHTVGVNGLNAHSRRRQRKGICAGNGPFAGFYSHFHRQPFGVGFLPVEVLTKALGHLGKVESFGNVNSIGTGELHFHRRRIHYNAAGGCEMVNHMPRNRLQCRRFVCRFIFCGSGAYGQRTPNPYCG